MIVDRAIRGLEWKKLGAVGEAIFDRNNRSIEARTYWSLEDQKANRLRGRPDTFINGGSMYLKSDIYVWRCFPL